MSIRITVVSQAINLESLVTISTESSISSIRERVYAMTGYEPTSMRFKINGQAVNDESVPISSYGSDGSIRIEVTGRSEFGDLGDTNGVEKYEMSDALYDAREGTIRDMKRKAGIKVKGEIQPKSEDEPEGYEIGARCEAEMPDKSHHRGTIRFVGKTSAATGYWIGIELDEPFGKNDGSIKGQKYFECEDKYGVFLKPAKVKVGDFPPIDWEDELKDEM